MTKALQPIGRSGGTLADEAYQRIADALLAGKLDAGSRLIMDQLAEELDISRTPVRDALLRLEREGLIEASGRRGYVVRAASDIDIEHFYEAREAVEGFAARRVAEIGPTAVDQVRKVVQTTDSAGVVDVLPLYRMNLRIHRSIVEAVGNPRLLDLFDDIWQRARGLSTFAAFVAKDRSHVSVQEAHLPLLDALGSTPNAAFKAMRAHIRAGHQEHH
jgi:DNA-binding GntR family transcriptional regulator